MERAIKIESEILKIKTKPWLMYMSLFVGILTVILDTISLLVFNRLYGTILFAILLFYMAYKYSSYYVHIEKGRITVQQTPLVSRSVSLQAIKGIVNKKKTLIIKTGNKDITIVKNYIDREELQKLLTFLKSYDIFQSQ